MGYSGYDQVLCQNGHAFCVDVYDQSGFGYPYSSVTPQTWKCPVCEAGVTWWSSVDTTNDEGDPVRLVLHTERQMCTCADCGHEHEAVPATYKIPLGVGHLVHPPSVPYEGEVDEET